ncbi:unnamed protein product, partial [Choristocarpus tenellus]
MDANSCTGKRGEGRGISTAGFLRHVEEMCSIIMVRPQGGYVKRSIHRHDNAMAQNFASTS